MNYVYRYRKKRFLIDKSYSDLNQEQKKKIVSIVSYFIAKKLVKCVYGFF